MSQKRILIAEDDPNIRIGLVDTLESEGYQVRAASDGLQALAFLKQDTYELAMLDVMMPGKDGYELCQHIRTHHPNTAVVMLTAKSQEIDKVLGLKLGADDYITKPFGVSELLARVEAVLRRLRHSEPTKQDNLPTQLDFGSCQANRSTYKLIHGAKAVDLSDRELKLLEQFYSHPGEVLSRNDLLDRVWGVEYYGTTRTLDQHIAQLRKKLSQIGVEALIETVHGVGYRVSK